MAPKPPKTHLLAEWGGWKQNPHQNQIPVAPAFLAAASSNPRFHNDNLQKT
jgi:hypothetical protein